jgi:hypothetical protein
MKRVWASIRQFVRNRGIWVLFGIVFGLVAMLTLGRIGVNEYAKRTWLQEFYQQAERADLHARSLKNDDYFKNFIVSVPTDGTQHRGSLKNPGSEIDYCTRAGTYHDNTTNQTIHGARTCHKGVANFYWLEQLDEEVVHHAAERMGYLGWKNTDVEYDESDHLYLQRDLRDGKAVGHSFARDDGTYADLMFYTNKPGSNIVDWCGATDECEALGKIAPDYRYYMSIETYAYHDYTD